MFGQWMGDNRIILNKKEGDKMPKFDLEEHIHMNKEPEVNENKYKIKCIKGFDSSITENEVNKFLKENNAQLLDFKVVYNPKNLRFLYVYVLKYLEE